MSNGDGNSVPGIYFRHQKKDTISPIDCPLAAVWVQEPAGKSQPLPSSWESNWPPASHYYASQFLYPIEDGRRVGLTYRNYDSRCVPLPSYARVHGPPQSTSMHSLPLYPPEKPPPSFSGGAGRRNGSCRICFRCC